MNKYLLLITILSLLNLNATAKKDERIFFEKQLNDTLRISQIYRISGQEGLFYTTVLENTKSKKKLTLSEDSIINRPMEHEHRGKYRQVYNAVLYDKTIYVIEFNYGNVSIIRYDFTAPNVFTQKVIPVYFKKVVGAMHPPKHLYSNFIKTGDSIFFVNSTDYDYNAYNIFMLNPLDNTIEKAVIPYNCNFNSEKPDSVQRVHNMSDVENTPALWHWDYDKERAKMEQIVRGVVFANTSNANSLNFKYYGYIESATSNTMFKRGKNRQAGSVFFFYTLNGKVNFIRAIITRFAGLSDPDACQWIIPNKLISRPIPINNLFSIEVI